MRLDIVTIFPGTVKAALQEGVVRRAMDRRVIDVQVHDLRDYTDDRHRTVDDVPYGGGPGMVLKSEPLFRAVGAVRALAGAPQAVVLTSPQGRRLLENPFFALLLRRPPRLLSAARRQPSLLPSWRPV